MTSHEYNTLNNMIDSYTNTHDYKSVSELLSEIEDGMVLDFLRISVKYSGEPELMISKLKYIRDHVVSRY